MRVGGEEESSKDRAWRLHHPRTRASEEVAAGTGKEHRSDKKPGQEVVS